MGYRGTKTSPETLTAAVKVATVTMGMSEGPVLYYSQFPDKMFHFSNSIIKSTEKHTNIKFIIRKIHDFIVCTVIEILPLVEILKELIQYLSAVMCKFL